MEEFEIEFDITPNEYEIDIEDMVLEIKPTLEDLEVMPSTELQEFTPVNSIGFEKVVVNPIEVEELNVIPSKEEQNYDGLYNKVNVKAVTSDIDSNIVADNIKQGVEILGVVGTMTGGKYKPRDMIISFKDYTGTELDYETQNLDTSNLTSAKEMFYGCSKITSLNLSGWNTENIIDMSSMFSGCSYLEYLDVSNFNTSKVTTMASMFYGMRWKLKELDLSSFDTSNVTNMGSMFYNLLALERLDIRNFTFDKVTSYSSMFNRVPVDCLIVVKGDTEKEWVLARRSDFTNVKTVAEYESN